MRTYTCLSQQEFSNGEYRLVPIRHEDRFEIMKWRNEQIYHLRQKELLTEEQQDAYFENVVAKLFIQEQPDQLLFSFLKDEELVGYGGLVHINWEDKNAEVSFLTKNHDHLNLWQTFLTLLKKVSFEELHFNKIYTYAFDVRPELYSILEVSGFILEGNYSNHIVNESKTLDVRLHSCFNETQIFWRRFVTLSDAKQLYYWANDLKVRAQSLNTDPIAWLNHLEWFCQKIQHPSSRMYIYHHKEHPVGSLRLDFFEGRNKISYLVDLAFRGKGFGKRIIEDAIIRTNKPLIAEVKVENMASNKVFEKLNFELHETKDDINTWIYER